MGRARDIGALRGALAALCGLAGLASASAQTAHARPAAEIPHTQPPASEAERLLAIHNAERARLGVAPLRWNPDLARQAGDWAHTLLARRTLEHADPAERRGAGENLWMGTAGGWSPDGMAQMFLDERRLLRPAAKFPDVSVTGSWKDVGHYTQMVWRGTREVGCAVRTGHGLDVLVCRYLPAGNVLGEAPF